MRTSNPHKNHILDLAIAYHAFSVASDEEDAGATWMWGDVLRDTQRILGVVLVEEALLGRIVERARRRALEAQAELERAEALEAWHDAQGDARMMQIEEEAGI